MRVARAALIWVWVPLRVRVEEPLAPALMVAPVEPRVTLRVPWVTVRRVVARLPSTSLTLMRAAPVKASEVSSLTVLALGTVLTGALLTAS